MANTILYGFENLESLANSKVTEVGVSVVEDAINKALMKHNEELSLMSDFFVERTTNFKTKFKSAVNTRSQPLDQNGRALPIKAQGIYEVAFPIQGSGGAWGANYVTMQKMTVKDVRDKTNTMLIGDINWMRDHILAALFAKNGWTYADEEHGDLIVKGLADGDTDQYFANAGSQTTDDHYLAQNTAISDATNPFKQISLKLKTRASNAGEVVVFVASDLVDDIENLANFKERPDVNIRQGANADVLVGVLPNNVPGEVKGYVDGCWIVEWATSLPSGYWVATTTDGDKPIAMREHPESNLQGFVKVAERNDHPFYESQYLRFAGFGAWNRVGAVVGKVGAASYAIPTSYGSPMR